MTAPASDVDQARTLPPRPVEPTRDLPAIPLKRLAVMGVIVSAFLLVVNGFVCATLDFFLIIPGWPIWQFIPGILPIAFVLTTILGFRYSNGLLQVVYAISAAFLGALNFAFFAAVLCWLVALPDWLLGWPVPRFALAATLFSLALLVTIYGLFNASWLRVTRVAVRLPNLPETWQERSIALVTDLHLGHLSSSGFLHRVLSKLRSLQPDMVLVSGDMFDGTTVGLEHHVSPWQEYSAPRGIFYVTGNHDEFADRQIYLNAVKPTGVHALNNEKVTIEGLQIIGVHDSEAGDAAVLRTILQSLCVDPQRPSILLAHRPENLPVAAEEGISLQLSGHTHGGQLWPWTLLVTRIYGRFAHGLQRLGKLQVYTSYGVGTWGPPLRVGTKSEIVLIQLRRQE